MMSAVRLAIGLMLTTGALAMGAGFDGDAEHLKQTRMPIPLLKGIGSVDFRMTCQNAQTQQYFNQGIALLHGYEPREADRSFYQACRIEPSCPMTWWGLAAANLENRPLAAFYVERAFQLREAASEREKAWINAFKIYLDPGSSDADRRTFLLTSLDRIVTQFPDDLEASAFLARQFVENREAGLPIPLMTAADLTIEHVLRHNPAHPAHHYKLLLWEGVEPGRALQSAELVRHNLPSAARIQTAAGRVYSRLERYDDALSCFEASATIALHRIERDKSFPTGIDGFIENTALQIDHLVLGGRISEASTLARSLVEMPFLETPEPVITTATNTATAHGMRTLPPRAPALQPTTIGRQKLLELLTDYCRWDELLSLDRRNYFQSDDPNFQSRRIYSVGLACYSRQDAAAIASQIDKLAGIPTSAGRASGGFRRGVDPAQVEAAISDLRICEALARNGDRTPTELVPSRQLTGLFPGVLDRETARRLAAEPGVRQRSAAPGLNRIRLLRSIGRSADAITATQELKQQFPRIDASLIAGRDSPVSALDTPASDLTATTISPTWHPPLAPEFKLSNQHGEVVSLETYRGKRVVLVFYLGAGCPHCIEQLQTFAPLKDAYDAAGLTVIAVSTDSVAGLQKTLQVAGAGDAIPFLLVSDEKLSTFRDFGAFDPRDNEPLHGTFLINPHGRIVWHNIRREPFMATRSLLDEARRVFSLDEATSGNAATGVSAR
jgi:peroxiredoxin